MHGAAMFILIARVKREGEGKGWMGCLACTAPFLHRKIE